MKKTIIWWGRSDHKYSRNRILRKILIKLGFSIVDFYPYISSLGYYEALLKIKYTPEAIWVPCFRHRDIISAHLFAKKYDVPLIFDPLISSWDKKINEKKRFPVNSFQSKKLMDHESKLFQMCDILIADTEAHKEFFNKFFKIPKCKINVIYVGAEEDIFYPYKTKKIKGNNVLFYGSGLELHGIDTIIKAAEILNKNKINFTLIGNFKNYKSFNNIKFEPPINLEKLPQRINNSDLMLGIFSGSEKANNVIPNKLYQSIACGRPIITRASKAFPSEIQGEKNGIFFVKPNDPIELSKKILYVLDNSNIHEKSCEESRKTYLKYFSEDIIKKQIIYSLKKIKIYL